jgi:hypothetical protein
MLSSMGWIFLATFLAYTVLEIIGLSHDSWIILTNLTR